MITMEPYTFLSSYTGISPQLLSMGPLDLNQDLFNYKNLKNKSVVSDDSGSKEKIDLSDYTDLFNKDKDKDKNGKGKGSIVDDIIRDVLDKNKKDKEGEGIDYEKMTGYAKSVIGEVDKVAQKARERDFFREGIRSLANAPLIGAQANLEAAKNIADLTALNMGAMAAQNRVLESNPTKQRFAGKYFR